MFGVPGRVRVGQQWPDMQAMSSLQRLRGAAQKRCPDKGKRMTPGRLLEIAEQHPPELDITDLAKAIARKARAALLD